MATEIVEEIRIQVVQKQTSAPFQMHAHVQ